MRKLDKSKILSSEYKSWEETLENNNTKHPNYNSSNKYYKDVVLNLLNIQQGLCAYTEIRLCSPDIYQENHWENGKYSNQDFEIKGQLDHFDPSLKPMKGWLWDNFFFIDSDVNVKVKGPKPADSILKPDGEDYDEESMLEYNSKNGIFIANTDLLEDQQERINSMIKILGINFDPIKNRRKKYIDERLKRLELGIDNLQTIVVDEFPTAFRMSNIPNQ